MRGSMAMSKESNSEQNYQTQNWIMDTNQSLFKAEYTPTVMSPNITNNSLEAKREHPHENLLSPPEQLQGKNLFREEFQTSDTNNRISPAEL